MNLIWKKLQRHFLTGIAAVLPLTLTVYILALIIRFANNLIGNYINGFLFDKFGLQLPGLGLIVAFLGILLVGLLYNCFFGYKILYLVEKIFVKIPIVSNIYPSVKQLSDFMFKSKTKEDFKKVVLVQFPEKGTQSVGFITNEDLSLLSNDKEKLVSVFVPLAPAPFSGHILLVTKDRYKEIDLSVDQAIKFIVSGGVVLS